MSGVVVNDDCAHGALHRADIPSYVPSEMIHAPDNVPSDVSGKSSLALDISSEGDGVTCLRHSKSWPESCTANKVSLFPC